MQKLYALVFILFSVSLFSAQTTDPAKTATTPATGTVTPATNGNGNGNGSGARDYLRDLPAEKKSPVKIPKFLGSPNIDGKLDDEMWKTAAVFNDFIQVGPGNNVAPSKPTEVYMGYDEKHLYIAFKCWDERDKIKATLAKRDEVFGEDNVRMWLDTYNDQRRAYVVGFNPLGIQQDGIFTEGQGADFSVDIVMESKGVLEEWGWSVEVKIPFKSLRYVAGKGKLWGINFARNIDRLNDEFDQWLPDDRNVSGFLIKHGKITGLDEIKAERTLEIVPSITVSETGRRKRTKAGAAFNPNGPFDPIFNPNGIQDPGRFVNDPIKHDIGVTVKYTITPNITLDAAYNPDFAEIEADAPVVTANQRFPIFFQEKRPFFLEGQDIFSTPLSVFYSRTIVDPDLAAKLTGKVGKNSFGFLVASDKAPGNFSDDERAALINCQRSRPYNSFFVVCPNEDIMDKNAFFSVLRFKRDVGKENNVGFFGTARIFPKNRNFVGGFDGKFKLDPKTVMQFQVVGTHSRKTFRDPDPDLVNPVFFPYRTGNGFGYFWNLDYTTDTYGWYMEASGRTGDYRADSGFTRRTNTNTLFGANRFSTKSKPKASIIRMDWQQFGRFTYDWQGREQGGFMGTGLNLQLQGTTYLYMEGGVSFEKIYEEEFGLKRVLNSNGTTFRDGAFSGKPTRSATQPYINFNINKRINKQLFFYGFVGSVWNAFDFDFGAGDRFQRVSPGWINFLAAYLQDPNQTTVPFPDLLDPGRGYQFDAQMGVEYKPINPLRVSLDYTKSQLTRNDTDRVAFDTNIFTLRSTYQFSRFTFVRARWDYDSLSSNASGQFLFGWNPNPGTAFYVGYNDNFNYGGFNPYTGQHEPRFERNSRTFFIRASYLFRKSF